MNQVAQRGKANIAPTQAEAMIDKLFKNLAASCPILLNVTGEQLDSLKQQWILGFAENGITTFEQVKRGMAAVRAKANGYLPSIGEFVAWCKSAEDAALGLPNEDELMVAYRKFINTRGDDVESYPWQSNAEYHLVCNLSEAVKQGNLTDPETRVKAKKLIAEMANFLRGGGKLSAPAKRIERKSNGRTLSHDEKLAVLSRMRQAIKNRQVKGLIKN